MERSPPGGHDGPVRDRIGGRVRLPGRSDENGRNRPAHHDGAIRVRVDRGWGRCAPRMAVFGPPSPHVRLNVSDQGGGLDVDREEDVVRHPLPDARILREGDCGGPGARVGPLGAPRCSAPPRLRVRDSRSAAIFARLSRSRRNGGWGPSSDAGGHSAIGEPGPAGGPQPPVAYIPDRL